MSDVPCGTSQQKSKKWPPEVTRESKRLRGYDADGSPEDEKSGSDVKPSGRVQAPGNGGKVYDTTATRASPTQARYKAKGMANAQEKEKGHAKRF